MRRITAHEKKKAKRDKKLSRCYTCVRKAKCMDAFSAATFDGKCLPSGS